MATKHEKEYDLDALHKEGACLARHQARTEGNKCSHQDQARLRCEGADRAVYAYPAYKSLCKEGKRWNTRQRISGSGNPFPEGYYKSRKCPKEGEWDPGKGQNFHHFLCPYWHNSHHIVPNGSLKTAIADAATSDARLDNLIRAGLLAAEYNLNDQNNMINLPMESVIGDCLRLPRHLLGDEVPAGQEEFFSHVDYNRRVEARLNPIMDEYKAALVDALKDHPESPKTLSKMSLEKLSTDIHSLIVTTGASKGGIAISEIVF